MIYCSQIIVTFVRHKLWMRGWIHSKAHQILNIFMWFFLVFVFFLSWKYLTMSQENIFSSRTLNFDQWHSVRKLPFSWHTRSACGKRRRKKPYLFAENGMKKGLMIDFERAYLNEQSRNSLLVRFWRSLKLLQNLINRDFTAQFVYKLCTYKYNIAVQILFKHPVTST